MISEPLVKLVKAARVVGCLYIAIGAVNAIRFIVNYGEPYPHTQFILLGVDALLEPALGLVFLWSAGRLELGRLWAGWTVFTLSTLVCLNVAGRLVIGMLVVTAADPSAGGVMLVMMLIFLVPAVWLEALCFNAFGELRHMQRAARRNANLQTHGFPVVPKGSNTPAANSMASVKPPPPARSLRR